MTPGRWWVEDFHDGFWLVTTSGWGEGADAWPQADALEPKAASSRLDAWFPEGFGDASSGSILATIAAALGNEVLWESDPSATAWHKRVVRDALRDGRLVALRMRLPAPTEGLNEREDAVPAKAPVRETTWVEFKVVDARNNRPIPRIQMRVTLPDGSESAHTTNQEGLVTLDPLRSAGSCGLTFSNDDLRLTTTLEFVGIGDGAIDEATEDRWKNGAGALRVAIVEHHKVRTGESLDSLAKANGMTWRELAKFNFGTDDPNKINALLRSQVGCTRRTGNRKNYVFSDSDDPGIVYIPRRLSRRGLSTGLTHVLRVQPIERPRTPFLFSI